MNRIFKYIISSLLPLTLLSCIKEDMPVMPGNETIVLSINSGVQTKAVADTDVEAKVSHIDVLIFDASEAKVHYERVVDNGTNRYALAAKRSSFTANTGYHVYLVANSSDATATFESLASLSALKAKISSSPNLIFTGLNGEGDPQTFIMDAVAYQGSAEPATPGTVVLNDGVLQNSTEIKAVLRRAAAKIFVTINEGADVTLATESADIAKSEYFMRNLPYTTPYLAGVAYMPSLALTARGSLSDHFVWTENKVTVTAYAYAHDWKNESVLEKETSLVVNIPLTYQGTKHTENWYKIPVSKESRLDRNTYYAVTVTVNAPGAKTVEDPLLLVDVNYSVIDWDEVTISLGDESNRPKYLQLNTNSIEIFNKNEDSEQLSFASSSPIASIVLTEAYYYNKHGVKTNVPNDVKNKISASASRAVLNGSIKVVSPIVATAEDESPSHYNTVRYLTFVVTNEQGLTQTFTVAQYPVIYITNSLGWYSYRKDFKTGSNVPTTYQVKGPDRYVSVSLNISGNGAYDWTNVYSTSGNSGYWFSKVRTGTNTTGNTQVSYYYWDRNSSIVSSRSRSTDNVRLYHVHVTTTSGEYTVARPKMIYDENLNLEVTDPSAENAKLVSPSFMIASRLGYFITDSGNLNRANDNQRLEIFRVHCANYVEVHGDAANPVVYDNWRLPTEAELKIIMDTQGQSGEDAAAVDYLLNAGYYFGAAGPVWNSKNDDGIGQGESTSSKSVRCVRDAY